MTKPSHYTPALGEGKLPEQVEEFVRASQPPPIPGPDIVVNEDSTWRFADGDGTKKPILVVGDPTNPKDLVGVKKPQINLVPPALLIHVSQAMANGAAKFGPYNWRDKQVRMTIYIAAAMRHLLQLLDGEDNAQDSGVHHAAHAAACMGIILDAAACGALIDDRPIKGPASQLIEKFTKN